MGKDLLFVSLLLVSRRDDRGIDVWFVLKKTATHSNAQKFFSRFKHFQGFQSFDHLILFFKFTI